VVLAGHSEAKTVEIVGFSQYPHNVQTS